MKSDILKLFPFLGLTSTALVIFFVLFCGSIVYVYSRYNYKKYERLAHLPLEETE